LGGKEMLEARRAARCPERSGYGRGAALSRRGHAALDGERIACSLNQPDGDARASQPPRRETRERIALKSDECVDADAGGERILRPGADIVGLGRCRAVRTAVEDFGVFAERDAAQLAGELFPDVQTGEVGVPAGADETEIDGDLLRRCSAKQIQDDEDGQSRSSHDDQYPSVTDSINPVT